MPLRYNISSWRQLPNCLSNNSKDLSIHVSDFMNNSCLTGFKISVNHTTMGTLFACVIGARGSLVSRDPEQSLLDDPVTTDLSTKDILKELYKFGFHVTYCPRKNLSGDQLQYLITLKGLHFDKLRKLSVWKTVNGEKQFSVKLVAFQSEELYNWLNNGYSPSYTEFSQAVTSGYAVNLTEISYTRNYRWDWLDYVASVDDVLRDNSGDSSYGN